MRARQVNAASKVKRAMRAAEFKEKFEKYEAELTRIQTDLLLREVSGLSDAQAEAFKYQLSAAEAHRRDLEAMMEELRAENARLIQEVEATGAKEVQAAMGKLRSESKSAVTANVPRRVPRDEDGFTIICFDTPAGLERVFAFASKQPIPEWSQMASIQNNVQRTAALSRCLAGCTSRDVRIGPGPRRDFIHSSGGNVQNKVAFSVLTFQLFE